MKIKPTVFIEKDSVYSNVVRRAVISFFLHLQIEVDDVVLISGRGGGEDLTDTAGNTERELMKEIHLKR